MDIEGRKKKRSGRRRSGGSTVYNRKSQYLIFEYHDFRCVFCNNQFPYEELTRDHIIPVSRDGEIGWTNIVPSCHKCNQDKDNNIFIGAERDALLNKARLGYEHMLRQRGLSIVKAYQQKLKTMNETCKQVNYIKRYLEEAQSRNEPRQPRRV
jgi:NAD-dependent SIR2 family protein deacetylase